MSRFYFDESKAVPTPSGAYAQPVVNTDGSQIGGGGSKTAVDILTNDYSVNNVTNAAYYELIASTSGVINFLDIFDTSGEEMIIAVGGAGSEVDQFDIPPGGNVSALPLYIPAGSRISIKSAVTPTVNVGNLTINCLS